MTKKLITLYRANTWDLALEFKSADCWIGVFYKNEKPYLWHVWVCIIPMFPLHFRKIYI